MTVSEQSRNETTTRHPPHRVLWGLFRAARPKQWAKNVLVVAAPAAAGVLTEPAIMVRTAVAFVCFCLVASGTYLLNDAMDVEADRQHPRKRNRPIAAGIVPVRLAVVMAGVALGLGIGVAWLMAGWPLALVFGVYVIVMQAYSLGMKRIAVIELAMVSSGFVLRAIAGGVAANVEISSWFLVVTSFASLFIVAGKRHGEVMTLGTGAVGHREALREYPEGFMQYVAAVAAAVAIMGYCLWSLLEPTSNHVWFQLSIVPFVLAILRYELLVEEGHGGEPEEVFRSNRELHVLGAMWVALVMAGVYAG